MILFLLYTSLCVLLPSKYNLTGRDCISNRTYLIYISIKCLYNILFENSSLSRTPVIDSVASSHYNSESHYNSTWSFYHDRSRLFCTATVRATRNKTTVRCPAGSIFTCDPICHSFIRMCSI